jgi:phenylacetate-CoA ligase
VLDPDTGAPVEQGQIGTLVATPFPPFRHSMLLLRYDTEDLVRIPIGPLTCRLKTVPATGPVLGKRRLTVAHERGWTTPRDVLEALEAIEAVPLPARCGFRGVRGGVSVEFLVRESSDIVRGAIRSSLERHGIPLRDLRLVEDQRQLENPLPLRCDLREASLAAPAAVASLALVA